MRSSFPLCWFLTRNVLLGPLNVLPSLPVFISLLAVSDWRSEDKFQSKMLKKTSSETTEEIQVQRLARTAGVAGSLSPTQHPAPSNHSLVGKSGLQKCPLIPIHRGVVAEQSSEVRAVPSAPVVKTESSEVRSSELTDPRVAPVCLVFLQLSVSQKIPSTRAASVPRTCLSGQRAHEGGIESFT